MTRRINGDALQNRDGTAVTGDVFVFDDAHADGGEWQAPGAGSASAAWPVGSIFLSAVATDPATLLGFGTWSAIGAGRVLIGQDTGDTDFDTLGETGGAKTSAHAHGAGTLATSGGSWHSHGAGTIATVAESSHTHGVGTIDAGVHSSHNHDYGTLATSAHISETLTSHSWDHKHDITTAGNATISAHAVVMVVLQTAFRDIVASESIKAMTMRLSAWSIILVLMLVQRARSTTRQKSAQQRPLPKEGQGRTLV